MKNDNTGQVIRKQRVFLDLTLRGNVLPDNKDLPAAKFHE